MKIMFLTEFPVVPHLGGIERVTYTLAENFIKKGHNVSFVSLRTIAYNDGSTEFSSFQYFLADDKEKQVISFNKIIEELKPDIIINQLFTTEGAELLGKITDRRIKRISVWHNQPFAVYGRERFVKKLTFRNNLKGKLLKYIGICFPFIYRQAYLKSNKRKFNYILSKSDRIFLLSDKFIARILRVFPGLNLKKFDAINNPNAFPLSMEKLEDKENILLFVGRLEDPQKNVRGFIDVWKNFYPRHKDWKALIIGDGPHRSVFEEYARRAGVEALEFLGNRKDINNYYRRAKLLCMPSVYEGWPMVLAESMALECVPVAFDSFESVNEIIKNDKTGFIVPSFDTIKMTDSLDLLAHNEAKRKEMASAGKSHLKNFEASKIAEIWIEKLSSLISEKQ